MLQQVIKAINAAAQIDPACIAAYRIFPNESCALEPQMQIS